MRKVFLAEVKSKVKYYDDYDDFLNISEERYFEVDEETFEKLNWYCSQKDEYILIEWVEDETESYQTLLDKVNKAWNKELIRREKQIKAEEQRRAKSEEASRKRKLKQLEKLQKELADNGLVK